MMKIFNVDARGDSDWRGVYTDEAAVKAVARTAARAVFDELLDAYAETMEAGKQAEGESHPLQLEMGTYEAGLMFHALLFATFPGNREAFEAYRIEHGDARDTDNCNLLGMARIVCDKLEALEDTSTC